MVGGLEIGCLFFIIFVFACDRRRDRSFHTPREPKHLKIQGKQGIMNHTLLQVGTL